MPSFQFQFSTLRSIARVASTDVTRLAICGVHAILIPGKPVRLEATDGRRLIIHDTEWTHDATEDADTIIPNEILKATRPAKAKRAKKRKMRWGSISQATIAPPDRIEFEVGKDSVIHFNGYRISFERPDFKYPNTQSVFPAGMPTEFPATSIVLNMRLLVDVLAVVADLAQGWNGDSVSIVGKGEMDPIIVLAKRTTGALMPMRADGVKLGAGQ